jgi:acetyl esterase/lipase
LVEALAPFGLDGLTPPPPVTASSPREAQLAFLSEAEERLEAMLSALNGYLPAVAGVRSESITISGDGGEITLLIDVPERLDRRVPCIVHLHGGGMVILQAATPVYAYWRGQLAATDVVVIGVEFRNGAGSLGCHPFPAGLNDCAAATRWALSNLEQLGASHVVVSGESGGGNLTLALAHKANREGWGSQIAGFYAQCPYISGAWADPPAELPSLRENDQYFTSCARFEVMMEAYDPGAEHIEDPMCWPLRAAEADLVGLPPHVISVNELDPLRDEGLQYYRRLRRAGVSAIGRVVAGTCHTVDIWLPAVIPDVHGASVRDVSGFAHSLLPDDFRRRR